VPDGNKALLVPAALAEEFVVVKDAAVASVRRGDVTVHRQQTFGLTGARLSHLDVAPVSSSNATKLDYRKLAADDLLSIALGASTTMLERATAHALTRVQFPGLFKDENGRDGVGKFGAVKKQLSEIDANR